MFHWQAFIWQEPLKSGYNTIKQLFTTTHLFHLKRIQVASNIYSIKHSFSSHFTSAARPEHFRTVQFLWFKLKQCTPESHTWLKFKSRHRLQSSRKSWHETTVSTRVYISNKIPRGRSSTVYDTSADCIYPFNINLKIIAALANKMSFF